MKTLMSSLTLAVALAACPPAHGQPAAGGLATVRELVAAGRHAEAVAAADAFVAALPPASRMTAWEVGFGGRVVSEALIGERYAYFETTWSRRDGMPARTPELPDERPPIRHDKEQYDQTHAVTCVDATTGKRLWTRRFSGRFRYVLGPGDDLWAQMSKVFRLDAVTGEVKLERDVGAQWRGVHGLLIDGRPYAHEHDNSMRRPAGLTLFDVETGRVERVAQRPGQRSPNGLRVLRRTVAQSPQDVTTTVALTTPDGGTADWTYATPGYSSNDPVWLGPDALVLSGTHDTRGAVARLDGGSGAVRWTTVLPHGAYALEHVYLASNGHLSHRWDAVGVVAGHVAAIDGRGGVAFMDPETGAVRAATSRAPAHLAMPRQVGSNVVLAGTDALVAVPADVLLSRVADGEREALVLKGRSLLATGKAREAAEVARAVTDQAPDFADGWRLRADAAAAGGPDPLGPEAARVRAMALAGDVRSPELLASHGLVARIQSGPIRAELAPAGPFLYAGSTDGTLLKIDAHTVEVADVTRFPADIGSLQFRDNTLYRRGTDRHEEVVATIIGLPPPPAGSDPLYAPPTAAADAPRDWHSGIGYDGRAVRHNGRLYRPVHKGHVRVLDGQTLATHQTALEGIESWNYYVGPGGPLGYGTGGVYALDDRLVPVRKLIDAGGDRGNRRPYSVPLMAADGRTLAVAVYRSDQPVVQVWSADGREKLREEPAHFGGATHAEAGRLTALGGGYLLSGDELAWVPADRQRPPWRFALQPLPRRPMRHHSLHDLGFGVPRLVGGKLFVACRDGGIFVFDPDRVTAPGGKP